MPQCCSWLKQILIFILPLSPPTNWLGKTPCTAVLHFGLKWNNVNGSMRWCQLGEFSAQFNSQALSCAVLLWFCHEASTGQVTTLCPLDLNWGICSLSCLWHISLVVGESYSILRSNSKHFSFNAFSTGLVVWWLVSLFWLCIFVAGFWVKKSQQNQQPKLTMLKNHVLLNPHMV